MLSQEITIRKALHSDISDLKALADSHKEELGFVLRPALVKSINHGTILLAASTTAPVLLGFIDYHHRKDPQTTLYHIVVSSDQRRHGIGREMVTELCKEALALEKSHIVLKCPVNLSANAFYRDLGFQLMATETGKTRRLNVWRLDLTSNGL